jgi:hypothetical protein
MARTKLFVIAFFLFSFLSLAGCGSDGTVQIGVEASPACARVNFNQTQQFTAQVFNATDTSVTWSVDGGNNNGTIDPNTGLYTAPSTAPASPFVTVIATSKEDPTKSGQATAAVETDCPPTP